MRKRLIQYETFNKLTEGSVVDAGYELEEAADILAKALNVNYLELENFTESIAVYETEEGNHVYTSYAIDPNYITFDNIEELVINEAEQEETSKKIIAQMVEAIAEKNEKLAEDLFKSYVSSSSFHRNIAGDLSEVAIVGSISSPTKRDPKLHKRQKRSDVIKRIRAMMKSRKRRTPSQKRQGAYLRKRLRARLPKRARARVYVRYGKQPHMKKTMKEWYNICENINGYLDFRESGPVLKESLFKTDEKGNVIAVRIPSSKLRNEAKILQFDWKTLNTEVTVLREQALNLLNDPYWTKACMDLKRANGLSDEKDLQNVIENIVSAWPQLLYVTRNEMERLIAEALTLGKAVNFDDETCSFLAEGVLREVYKVYPERVSKVLHLAQASTEHSEDPYKTFEEVVSQFYPAIDQSTSVEMKVFEDLHATLHSVIDIAREVEDESLFEDAKTYIHELESILSRTSEPDLELVEEIVEWLEDLVETNLETSDWDVSNSPHMTVNGDHPRMAQNAKQGYQPSSDFSGDWGGTAPVSDGKSYKGGLEGEMRNKGFGNSGGKDTDPSLRNPYIPDSGKFTMKGAEGVDKDDDNLGTWQSGDTWPNTKNPYTPDSVKPKMKSDNLVVDA